MTLRQREVLEFIERCVAVNEAAPTYQEIADYFHFSKPTAWLHVQRLREMGHIKARRYVNRGLMLKGMCRMCGRALKR